MPNFDEMSRDELKEYVRKNEWESAIDLRASADEIRDRLRELTSATPTPVEVEPAPEPPVATETPASDEVDEDKGESASAPESGTSSDDGAPEPAPEPAPAEVATVGRFRVSRFSKWVDNGMIHRLAGGTVVTSKTHPIAELRAQGVPLEPFDGEDDRDPGVGHRLV